MFLIGSQSEVVSPKFLSFIFLLDYLITECIWDRTQNELSLKLLNLSRTVLCIFLQTPSLPFSFRDSVEAASDPGQVLYMYVVLTGTRMVQESMDWSRVTLFLSGMQNIFCRGHKWARQQQEDTVEILSYVFPEQFDAVVKLEGHIIFLKMFF